jgi:hypothetical protein
MVFPVSIPLPCPPISVQVCVRDTLIPSHTVIAWQVQENRRYICHREITPGSIVANGTVPTPLVWAIPVTVIEEDIRCDIRAKIGIRPWYNSYHRWSRNHKRRETDPDV